MLPTPAERALAPISSSSGGMDSIANPPLNNDLGTIIAFPDEHACESIAVAEKPI